MTELKYRAQAGQDAFAANVNAFKTGGTFLEIGSSDAEDINNTYALERTLDWRGIMVESDPRHLGGYVEKREKSFPWIGDARSVDWSGILKSFKMPKEIDYLSLDLEVNNGSTLQVLLSLSSATFSDYKFRAVTFEHDVYRSSSSWSTREISRRIFERAGYYMVFGDVHDTSPRVVYEDWYVHPGIVDMDWVREVQALNEDKYVSNDITGRSIGGLNIVYPSR